MVMVASVVMVMIVMMPVERQRPLCACAKQGAVFWRIRHHLRRPFTAKMPVQTQHAVRGCHNNVQIMAHHQHSTAKGLTHALDLLVKACGTWLIKTLGRLVEDQDVGRLQ